MCKCWSDYFYIIDVWVLLLCVCVRGKQTFWQTAYQIPNNTTNTNTLTKHGRTKSCSAEFTTKTPNYFGVFWCCYTRADFGGFLFTLSEQLKCDALIQYRMCHWTWSCIRSSKLSQNVLPDSTLEQFWHKKKPPTPPMGVRQICEKAYTLF